MRRRTSKQHSLPRETDEDPAQEPILRFDKNDLSAIYTFASFLGHKWKEDYHFSMLLKALKIKLVHPEATVLKG